MMSEVDIVLGQIQMLKKRQKYGQQVNSKCDLTGSVIFTGIFSVTLSCNRNIEKYIWTHIIKNVSVFARVE